jgi:hypothetical protein
VFLRIQVESWHDDALASLHEWLSQDQALGHARTTLDDGLIAVELPIQTVVDLLRSAIDWRATRREKPVISVSSEQARVVIDANDPSLARELATALTHPSARGEGGYGWSGPSAGAGHSPPPDAAGPPPGPDFPSDP